MPHDYDDLEEAPFGAPYEEPRRRRTSGGGWSGLPDPVRQTLGFGLLGVLVILVFVVGSRSVGGTPERSAQCAAVPGPLAKTLRKGTEGRLLTLAMVAEPKGPKGQFKRMHWVIARHETGDDFIWAVSNTLVAGGPGARGAILSVSSDARRESRFGGDIDPTTVGLTPKMAGYVAVAQCFD